jgi:hypothetical protein
MSWFAASNTVEDQLESEEDEIIEDEDEFAEEESIADMIDESCPIMPLDDSCDDLEEPCVPHHTGNKCLVDIVQLLQLFSICFSCKAGKSAGTSTSCRFFACIESNIKISHLFVIQIYLILRCLSLLLE